MANTGNITNFQTHENKLVTTKSRLEYQKTIYDEIFSSAIKEGVTYYGGTPGIDTLYWNTSSRPGVALRCVQNQNREIQSSV